MSASPNWSLLLPDLLRSISEKLISLTDFLRFRAVCSHWRSASSSPPLHLPAQIPWLMLPFDPDPVGSFVVSFYDPVRSKIVKLDLPEMMGQRVCGSSHGWLVLEKVPEVCLFNPITRARISLPSLDGRANHLSFSPILESFWDSKNDFLGDYEGSCITKACLSCQPSVGSDCVVAALFWGNWEIAFCRTGDPCWTVLLPNNEEDPNWCAYYLTYLNGLLYFVCRSGALGVVNLSTPHRDFIPSSVDFSSCADYLCFVQGEFPAPFSVLKNYYFDDMFYYPHCVCCWSNDKGGEAEGIRKSASASIQSGCGGSRRGRWW